MRRDYRRPAMALAIGATATSRRVRHEQSRRLHGLCANVDLHTGLVVLPERHREAQPLRGYSVAVETHAEWTAHHGHLAKSILRRCVMRPGWRSDRPRT